MDIRGLSHLAPQLARPPFRSRRESSVKSCVIQICRWLTRISFSTVASTLSNPLVKAAYVTAFFKDIIDFYIDEYRQGNRPTMSVALLDGRIGLVGVSGEFFCGHSLELKRRARLDHLFFIGYCNDYQQYFPTIEGTAEGGYGGDPQVANAEVGAGEKMMNRGL